MSDSKKDSGSLLYKCHVAVAKGKSEMQSGTKKVSTIHIFVFF